MSNIDESLNVVRRAIGQPDLPLSVLRRLETSPHFELFDVKLPLPEFSGVPQEWLFVVLNKAELRRLGSKKETVMEDAHSIITAELDKELILIISDEPTIHLADEFGTIDGDVFCLDSAELPHTRDYATQPRLAPFILAIGRRLNINPLFARTVSPYLKATPARGWRFFGREKQLKEIIGARENAILVGARRVGKTSLLLEAQRRLQEAGVNVYYVDVQDARTENEVVSELVRVISPRDVAKAYKHHEVLHESVLSNLLRRLSAGPKQTVLLLDELGNVIRNFDKLDWGFMGTLRKYGSGGRLKYIISCFQEVFFRQQDDFGGPLINFGNTLRLEVFSRKEVEEFVIAPLEFWRPLGKHRQELLDLVISHVGCHPYFLQFFCFALFDRLTEDKNINPIHQANLLLKRDLHQWFSGPVDEIFFRMPSPTLQFLFLKRCLEADNSGSFTLHHAEFDDDWVEQTLADLGYRSTTRSRRNLLDGLEMHGLCSSIDYDRAKKIVAAPLIYRYVRSSNSSFEGWLKKLGKEIERERAAWELEPLSV